jgi:DNA-binding NtrC family response regulator
VGGGEGRRNAPTGNAPTVLIVEDERIARCALASLLDRSGFEAHAHESAEDALRDIEHGCNAEIALVDIDLPGMSGLDLIQRLEEKKPGLVAIVISAAGGERVDSFRRQHDVHYFRKPVDFPRLLGLLESTAAHHPPC